MNEKLFREKLAKILEKTAYRGLHTFRYQPLINDIVQAAKECEIIPEPPTTPSLLVGSEEE